MAEEFYSDKTMIYEKSVGSFINNLKEKSKNKIYA